MSTLMQDFFDQRAENWDNHVHNDHDRIAAILRLTGLKKGQRVLDIGCGTGVLVPHILPYEPADYQAIDVSEKMIALARQKAADKPVLFHCGDILDFSAAGFDWVIVFNAYPHLLEPEKLAAKLHQLLADGGRMVIAHDHSRQVKAPSPARCVVLPKRQPLLPRTLPLISWQIHRIAISCPEL